jgi:hypothetical protein
LQAPLHASQPCTCRPCQHPPPCCQPTSPHLQPASRPGPPGLPTASQPPRAPWPACPPVRQGHEGQHAVVLGERDAAVLHAHREAPRGHATSTRAHTTTRRKVHAGEARGEPAGRQHDERAAARSFLQQHVRPVDSRHQRPVRDGHTLGGACERGRKVCRDPSGKCSAVLHRRVGAAARNTAQRSTAQRGSPPVVPLVYIRQAAARAEGGGSGEAQAQTGADRRSAAAAAGKAGSPAGLPVSASGGGRAGKGCRTSTVVCDLPDRSPTSRLALCP